MSLSNPLATSQSESSDRLERRSHADLDLVVRANSGDRDAIDALAARMRFLPRLLVVLNRRHGAMMSDDEIEEISQTVVASVLEKLESYDGSSSFETWLCGFGSFHFANAARKKSRRTAKMSQRPFEEAIANLTAPPAAASTSDSGDDRLLLERALDRLGPPSSDVIRQRFFQEQSFEAIAARLQVKVATVKSWFYRGLRELAAKLTEDRS